MVWGEPCDVLGLGRVRAWRSYTAQSTLAIRMRGEEAGPLDAQVDARLTQGVDGPQRQGCKGTLGNAAHPYHAR
eukprot:3566576-Pyramimonas_sp.AAC.1